mmetsp:Transcript_83588/g.150785  ORF Transcript_83588/g.150785 Transcript_83588/m.150785 type:complete len:225 (+) Transcript_83588:679-1353(+)
MRMCRARSRRLYLARRSQLPAEVLPARPLRCRCQQTCQSWQSLLHRLTMRRKKMSWPYLQHPTPRLRQHREMRWTCQCLQRSLPKRPRRCLQTPWLRRERKCLCLRGLWWLSKLTRAHLPGQRLLPRQRCRYPRTCRLPLRQLSTTTSQRRNSRQPQPSPCRRRRPRRSARPRTTPTSRRPCRSQPRSAQSTPQLLCPSLRRRCPCQLRSPKMLAMMRWSLRRS